MPDEDCPGLAMARAFGDFCLKDYGLISTPQVTYRKLTDRDEFVVLATDGVRNNSKFDFHCILKTRMICFQYFILFSTVLIYNTWFIKKY